MEENGQETQKEDTMEDGDKVWSTNEVRRDGRWSYMGSYTAGGWWTIRVWSCMQKNSVRQESFHMEHELYKEVDGQQEKDVGVSRVSQGCHGVTMIPLGTPGCAAVVSTDR